MGEAGGLLLLPVFPCMVAGIADTGVVLRYSLFCDADAGLHESLTTIVDRSRTKEVLPSMALHALSR